MAAIRHIFLIVIPGTLFLVAIGAWGLTGKALFPIRKLIDAIAQVKVQTDISDDLWVWGDRDLLAQVLQNLIGNAIKYNLSNGDPARTRKVEGVGLGLSLSREIARAHHGELTLDATPIDRVAFVLTLPNKANREVNYINFS